MIVDEFRQSLEIYEELLHQRERDPLFVLNTVDARLAEISNHVAVCHRVIAEQRAFAHSAFLAGTRKQHMSKAEEAAKVLEQVIAVQSDYFELRGKVLRRVGVFLRRQNDGPQDG